MTIDRQAPPLRVAPEAVQTDRTTRTPLEDGRVRCVREVYFFDRRGEHDSYVDEWIEDGDAPC